MTLLARCPNQMLEQFSLPPFRSRVESREFRIANDQRKYEMRKFFLYFGLIAFLAHGLLDYSAGGDHAWAMLTLRVICVAIMGLCAFLFHKGFTPFRADTIVIAYLFFPALTIIAMSAMVAPGTAADTYPFGLVILFAYGGAVLVPRSIKLVALCVFVYFLYIATVPFASISNGALVVNVFFVTVGLAAICFGSLTRERLERQQAAIERAMNELNSDLELSREEALFARDTAVEAKRAQAKFITSVSHELRTPLNAIIGFSDLMLNEIDGPVTTPSYAGYVRDIHRAGKGLLLDINDLLDVHRLTAGKMSWTDDWFSVDEMIDNAVSICRHEADTAGVRLIEARTANPVQAFGDTMRMTQVVSNLLINAIKFTNTGGTATISQTLETSGELRITVTDTGIGIAAEDLERIKSPFQQGEDGTLAKKKGGLGLGLAIVSGILEQINGRFEIESEFGVGTTCHVFLPDEKLFHNDAASVA